MQRPTFGSPGGLPFKDYLYRIFGECLYFPFFKLANEVLGAALPDDHAEQLLRNALRVLDRP